MINLFNYIDRPSPIHRLTGASKLVCLVAWSIAAMTSANTRAVKRLNAGKTSGQGHFLYAGNDGGLYPDE